VQLESVAFQLLIVNINRRRNKMLIILKRDEWDGLTFVKNHLDKTKLFKNLQEAQDFCEEFEIEAYQLVDVAI
jgi:hypothetical protein